MTVVSNELARRVARRHQAAVALRDVPVAKTRVEFSGRGRLSGVELAKMLEPMTGPLSRMVFHRGSAHEIGWAAVDPCGGVVSGALVFHLAVGEHEVRSWTEAIIDPAGTSIVVDPSHLRLIEPADRTAERVAVRYMRDSGGLVPVDDEDEPVDDEGEQVP